MFTNQMTNENLRETEEKMNMIQKSIEQKIMAGNRIADMLCDEEKPPINQLLLETQEDSKFSYENIEKMQPPAFIQGVNYYDYVWKTFIKNEILIKKVKNISQKNKALHNVINEIQRLSEEYHHVYKIKSRKKNRRLAIDIEKNFTCPYENCHKIYGSDVSLNLHIKLKHNGGNKTDREKLAQQICHAEQKGEPMPQMTLNLPPGYLNEYKKLYFQRELYNLEFPHGHEFSASKSQKEQ